MQNKNENKSQTQPKPTEEFILPGSAWTQSVSSFDDLELKPDLIRGIYGFGFNKPTDIQAKGILPLLKGKDTIAQAQSGTGKTGTFLISSLQVLDEKSAHTQIMILTPTRELAMQH
jgi:superfamily II DNA/RNA helicase